MRSFGTFNGRVKGLRGNLHARWLAACVTNHPRVSEESSGRRSDKAISCSLELNRMESKHRMLTLRFQAIMSASRYRGTGHPSLEMAYSASISA